MKTKELKLESDQADEMADDDAEVVVDLIARWILGHLGKTRENKKEHENPRASPVKKLP
jgi:hypothetical protein